MLQLYLSFARETVFFVTSVLKYAFFKNTSPTFKKKQSNVSLHPNTQCNILHTSHSVAPPMFPEEIPEMQSPLGSLVAGVKARSLGSIVKAWPPNVNATLAVVVQGTVKPP